MPDEHDMDLVREFAHQGSETAFAELVRRHINMVYSVAMRFTAHPEDAQDVVQAVFIIFAKKAAGLSDRTLLTGWLYETTRFTAAHFVRSKARRQEREQEAYMQSDHSPSDNIWSLLEPNLEAAMSRLNERDRALLALRFFENKTAAEAAALLGIREDAAHKRTNRALEKLRGFFGKRGIAISSVAIASALSANSVQAAPEALANTITALAAAKGAAAGGSTLTLVKGALKIMAWTKAKMAIAISVGILLGGSSITIPVIISHVQKGKANNEASLLKMIDGLVFENRNPPADLGFKLRLLGEPAVKSLISMLKTHDPALDQRAALNPKPNTKFYNEKYAEYEMHSRAATALGEIGPSAQTAIPALEKSTRDRNIIVASRAKAALIKIRQEPVEPLIALLQPPYSSNWIHVARVAKYLGTNAEGAVPILTQALQSKDDLIKEYAAEALCGIASRPDLSVPALIVCLDDKNASLRRRAIDGLCQFTEERQQIVPVFLNRMKDTDLNTWLGAAFGLEDNFISAPEVKTAYEQALVESLKSPIEIIQLNAAQFLKRIDPAAAAREGVK